MGRLRRKRMHKNNKEFHKKYKVKRRTKDLDEVHSDLKPDNAQKLLTQEDTDLPGSGRNYCITCARHFVTEIVLKEHCRTKPHKRRLRALTEPVYTQKEAERAAGMGNYYTESPPESSIDVIVSMKKKAAGNPDGCDDEM